MLILLLCSQACQESRTEQLQDRAETKPAEVSFMLPELLVDHEQIATRTALTEDYKAFWSSNDVIGIFPQEGSPIAYSITSDAGSSKVIFDGGGWKLRANTEYYAFYPFAPDVNMDLKHVPYSVEGQVQSINGAAVFDGFDCLAAKGTTNEQNGVAFKFHRLCCLVKVIARPCAGTYNELRVEAGSKIIPVSAEYDVTSDACAFTNIEYSDKFSVSLKNLKVSGEEDLVIYFAGIPQDWHDNTLTFSLVDSEGNVFTCDKAINKSIEANSLVTCDITDAEKDIEASFLNCSVYGMYSLSPSFAPFIQYESGKDSYAFKRVWDSCSFRIMNYSSDHYKFFELDVSMPESPDKPEEAVVLYQNTGFRSRCGDIRTIEMGVTAVQHSENGDVWYISDDGKYGFIIKEED